MWTGQNVGHSTGQSLSPHGQGSARELPQLRARTGASAAGQGWKVWNHPSAFQGTGSRGGASVLPQPQWSHFHCSPVKTLCMWPCNDFRREVHLIFIRCSRLWFYKLMEHMSAKAPKQSCCLQKLLADVLLSETCVENLCSTLCFVPPEITRFLLHWIITSYLIEMRPDQNKAGPLKGLQRGGHLPCKNCTRVWWIGHFQSFFRCIKKKISAIKLTTELLFPIFKTIIAHDVWVTNTS